MKKCVAVILSLLFLFFSCAQVEELLLPKASVQETVDLDLTPVVTTTEGAFGDRMVISWPRVEGAKSYRVYYDVVENGAFDDFEIIFDTNEDVISYTHTLGVVQYFRVSSVDETGKESGRSRPLEGRVLYTPSLVAAYGDGFDHINLYWNSGEEPEENVASYILQRESNGDWQTLVEGEASKAGYYRDDEAVGGATYRYRLGIVNLNGEVSRYFSTSTSTVDQNGPNPVRELSVTQGTLLGKVRLTWKQPEPLDGYADRKFNYFLVKGSELLSEFSPTVTDGAGTADEELEYVDSIDTSDGKGFEKISYLVFARFENSINNGFQTAGEGWPVAPPRAFSLLSSDLKAKRFDFGWEAPAIESEDSHYQLWGTPAGEKDPILMKDDISDTTLSYTFDYVTNPEYENYAAWSFFAAYKPSGTDADRSDLSNEVFLAVEEAGEGIRAQFSSLDVSKGLKARVTLEWKLTNETGVVSYRVFRSEAPTVKFVKDNSVAMLNGGDLDGNGTIEATEITEVTKLSYTDSTARGGKTYYYHVRAYDAAGGRVASSGFDSLGNPIADSDVFGYVLVSPPNFTASDSTAIDRIDLEWDAALGATEYKLYLGTKLLETIEGTRLQTSYDDLSGEVQEFRLVAVNASKEVSGDATASGSVLTGAAITPSATEHEYGNMIEVRWNPAAKGVTGYEIVREGISGKTFITVENADLATVAGELVYENSVDDAGSRPEIYDDYEYVIYPINGELKAGVSSPAAKGSLLNPPASLEVAGITGRSVKLKWDAPKKAQTYAVYARADDRDNFTKIVSTLLTTEYTHYNVLDQDYEYYVISQRGRKNDSLRNTSKDSKLIVEPFRYATHPRFAASDGQRFFHGYDDVAGAAGPSTGILRSKYSGYHHYIVKAQWDSHIIQENPYGKISGYEIYRMDKNVDNEWRLIGDYEQNVPAYYPHYAKITGGHVLEYYRHLFLLVPYVTLKSGFKARIGVDVDPYTGKITPLPTDKNGIVNYAAPGIDSSLTIEEIRESSSAIDSGYREISMAETILLYNMTFRASMSTTENFWENNFAAVAVGYGECTLTCAVRKPSILTFNEGGGSLLVKSWETITGTEDQKDWIFKGYGKSFVKFTGWTYLWDGTFDSDTDATKAMTAGDYVTGDAEGSHMFMSSEGFLEGNSQDWITWRDKDVTYEARVTTDLDVDRAFNWREGQITITREFVDPKETYTWKGYNRADGSFAPGYKTGSTPWVYYITGEAELRRELGLIP